jgi:hypothetical protein
MAKPARKITKPKPSPLPSRDTAATIPRFEMVTKIGQRITVARVSAQVNAIAERTKRRELVNG